MTSPAFKPGDFVLSLRFDEWRVDQVVDVVERNDGSFAYGINLMQYQDIERAGESGGACFRVEEVELRPVSVGTAYQQLYALAAARKSDVARMQRELKTATEQVAALVTAANLLKSGVAP